MESAIPASLLAVLDRLDTMSEPERQALAGLPWRQQSFQDGAEIIPEGHRPTESCVLLRGFTANVRYLANGDRQLTAIHVPGDFFDLHGLFLKVLDHGVVALTECQVALVKHEHLKRVTADHPHLGAVFAASIAREGALQRTWIVCMGRKDPVRRIAHLVCEMYRRLERAGGARDFQFEFPVTQAEIADLAGLSVVHTNRALQELRATGLMSWQGAEIRISNWPSLVAFAGFDETYLGLRLEEL